MRVDMTPGWERVVLDAARPGIERLGLEIEVDARWMAPVDTGALRASIYHQMVDGPDSYEVHIGATVSYAGYVELGTSRMHPQPFLRPATFAKRTIR